MLILTVLVEITAALEMDGKGMSVNYPWHMPLQHQSFEREHIVLYRTGEHPRMRYSSVRVKITTLYNRKIKIEVFSLF